jgi:hypothetical protein
MTHSRVRGAGLHRGARRRCPAGSPGRRSPAALHPREQENCAVPRPAGRGPVRASRSSGVGASAGPAVGRRRVCPVPVRRRRQGRRPWRAQADAGRRRQAVFPGGAGLRSRRKSCVRSRARSPSATGRAGNGAPLSRSRSTSRANPSSCLATPPSRSRGYPYRAPSSRQEDVRERFFIGEGREFGNYPPRRAASACRRAHLAASSSSSATPTHSSRPLRRRVLRRNRGGAPRLARRRHARPIGATAPGPL